MKFDQLHVERLFGEIEGAMRARARQTSRHLGDRFNLFSVLARYGNNDERYVHTPFLGTLLDPTAEHDLGDLFLREFLGRALNGLSDVPSDSLGGADVRVEDAGVDIRIMLDDFEIIVENKIHAPDQDEQLIRYIREARTAAPRVAVIYLTLRGTPPSKRSIGDTASDHATANPQAGEPRILESTAGDGPTPVSVVVLSYEHDVRKAIHACLNKCRSERHYNSDVAGALEQYSDVVDRVLGGNAMGHPSEEAAILMERPDNLAIGLRMQAAASEAYGQRVAQFLLELDKCLRDFDGGSGREEESDARQGRMVRKADISDDRDKLLEPAQEESWTAIRNWAAGNTKEACKHRAVLWYGVDDRHWAFSIELAGMWLFVGFVKLFAANGETPRIEDLSGEGRSRGAIPGWDKSVPHRYGLRHWGAWKNRSLVRALAEVPQGGEKEDRASLNPDDPYGISTLFDPKKVFDEYMKPYLGRPWSEIVGETVGNRQG